MGMLYSQFPQVLLPSLPISVNAASAASFILSKLPFLCPGDWHSRLTFLPSLETSTRPLLEPGPAMFGERSSLCREVPPRFPNAAQLVKT